VRQNENVRARTNRSSLPGLYVRGDLAAFETWHACMPGDHELCLEQVNDLELNISQLLNLDLASTNTLTRS
jgi:hypothetical protein